MHSNPAINLGFEQDTDGQRFRLSHFMASWGPIPAVREGAAAKRPAAWKAWKFILKPAQTDEFYNLDSHSDLDLSRTQVTRYQQTV